MNNAKATVGGAMAMFVALALVAAGVIAGLAYFPTVRLAGSGALPAMLLGCGISWLASCVGAVPVAWAVGNRAWNSGTVVLGGTALRFLTALVLATPAVFVPGIDKRVLLVCLAVSYMLMLPIDAYFAVRTLQRREEDES